MPLSTLPSPSARARRLRARIASRRFARSERGSLIVFGLFLFVLMLMVGGLSVDLMRYEADRSRIQNTADRAALAAASMRQELDPEAVVLDYFAKAGLAQYHAGTVVDEGLNYRNVKALTQTQTNTLFMPLMGIERLASSGAGAAEERITNVEIALVLDISGSMQYNNRMTNLKIAADEFVRKILEDDHDNRISISLVPFNGQVNLSPNLLSRFNITHNHTIANVNCVDLPASVYTHLVMSRTLPMERTAYADSFTTVSTAHAWQSPQAPNPANIWCPAEPNNFVRPLQNNVTQLRNRVQALQAIGATSIDAGLRWGLTLLDPASRGMISELIALGEVPSYFAGRPFNYDDPEVLKVVVLMTDGEHFPEERINTPYKTGLSPIWRSNGDGHYSIRHTTGRPSCAGSNEWWVPHLWSSSGTQPCGGAWRASPWNSGAGATQLTWVQVWQQLRVRWVAWQLYARALGTNNATRTSINNTWINTFRTLSDVNAMDARLNHLCTLAKNQSVVIFGVAFEAPPNGVEAIRNCASPNRFYDVQGLQIQTAFRQIRSQISSLRLTQ